MRYCNYCRQTLADGAAVCPVCGAAVPQTASFPAGNFQPALSENSVFDVLRSAGSSKLFLAAVIVFSVSLLLNIVNAFIPLSVDFSQLVGAENFFDVRALANIFNQLTRTLQIVSWFSWIPTAAICAGMWMFYSACKNPQESSVKTTGLTVIKVFALCSVVISAVFVIVFLIILFGIANVTGDPYFNAVMSTIIAMVVVALCIAVVPLIFYYVFIVKTINAIKQTATTGQPSNGVSTFVAVWNFITAGLQLITLFSTSVSITMAINACSIAFLIMMGIAILNYKASMRRLIYGIPWNR